ncbi:GAP family protein [Brevibacterium ravenspurgense]|uniref:GAP family protein n=1 Tax=Brevibacterium ravenspurgense TaxID=479117 RepID=UPI000ACFB3BC
MDLLSLIGLALLDSLSLGTLVIPVALAIRQQRVEFRPQALYFLTVCAAFFTLGIALLLGMDTLFEALTDILRTPPALWARLIIGVGLAAFGIFAKNPKKRTPEEIADQPAPKSLSTWAVIALGLSAAAAEAATMVPYLAAIGIMGNMGEPVARSPGDPGRVLLHHDRACAHHSHHHRHIRPAHLPPRSPSACDF